MWYDSEGVGVMLGLKDDVRSPLPPVGSFFDGVIHGHLLCTLGGRHCESNRQDREREVVTIWDDEMDVDVDLFDDALGEQGHPSFCKAARLLIAG